MFKLAKQRFSQSSRKTLKMGSRKRLSKNKPLKWANTEVWCQGKKIDTKGLVYRHDLVEPEPKEKKQPPQGRIDI